MSLPEIYTNEDAARRHLEALQWPDGVVCPHCGVVGEATLLKGKSTRPGVYKCKECEKPFSVKVGTVFEDSKVPLHQWLYAVHLYTASKKGFSAHQLHRTLKVTYKTAWFMAHRIREAMRPVNPPDLGGTGGIVEVDETYIGRQRGLSGMGGPASKNIVLTLVERGGSARSFHIDSTSSADIAPIVFDNIARESRLMTDEAPAYREPGQKFASHGTVVHSKGEYVRDGGIHTNTVEGFYSIFKRGMKGIYQHCAEKHLHRYLAEYDFRYTYRIKLGYDDAARAEKALKGIAGKRLTYRRSRSQETQER